MFCPRLVLSAVCTGWPATESGHGRSVIRPAHWFGEPGVGALACAQAPLPSATILPLPSEQRPQLVAGLAGQLVNPVSVVVTPLGMVAPASLPQATEPTSLAGSSVLPP